MALDAICLTAVVEELRRTLEGGKIDKIYQPSRDEVVMAVRGAGERGIDCGGVLRYAVCLLYTYII